VNHRPSFETDSPLDEKVKHSLLRDTFLLVNLTLPEKRAVCQQIKDLSEERIYKKRVRLDDEERRRLFDEAQARRDEYEAAHLGGFTKIFPVPGYEDIMKFIRASYKAGKATTRIK
jgi:hypothetical protein